MTDNPKKILIYSDLMHRKEWILRMVKKFNLDLFEADHGLEAVERTKVEVPDFVLLDVTMPKMGGIEAAAMIKELSSSVKVILISEIHSLSLQDSAKKARVDLFVIDSVAEVKIKEFVEAMLNRKLLPPDISENIEREVLSRRGARRFPMEGEVQYQIGDHWWSGLFSNVSQDGLLFKAKEQISLGQKILLSWIDQGRKHIEIPAITVRRVGSEQNDYPYLVGVQFLKSSVVLNQKIVDLEGEFNENQHRKHVDSDLNLIDEVLDLGTKYFDNVFQGSKAHPFMESSISNIVEHERRSFQKTDEYSRCVQELVTHKIITQLTENILDQLHNEDETDHPRLARVVAMAAKLLDKVNVIENTSDELVKKSIHENLNLERHHLNESNNLLYQAQDSLLRSITQKVKKNSLPEEFHEDYDQLHQKYKQLTSYQEHLEEIVRAEVVQQKKKSIVRTMKAAEVTLPEEMAPMVKTRVIGGMKSMVPKSVLPYFALLFVFASLLPWIAERMQISFASEDFHSLLKPRKIERRTHDRLIVDISKQSWDELGTQGQEMALTQVELYLTRKRLKQCKIVDGNLTIAAVLGPIDDSNGFLQKVFVESPPVQKMTKPASVLTPSDPGRKSVRGREPVHLD